LTYAQITRDWDGLVNYLKLDSISIVGWSDGGLLTGNGCLCKQIKKIVAMGAI
jgi:esterase/lipase